MDILYGDNQSEIKSLVSSKSAIKLSQLKRVLRMINLGGHRYEDLDSRRKVNKKFLDCLVEIEGSKPNALIWLKKHNSFHTCRTMLSDWKYTGKIQKKICKYKNLDCFI